MGVPLPDRAVVTPLPARRGPWRAAFVALRPRQWAKNLLLFAGIVFAAELGDPTRWAQAVAAFVAYCAASSASYLVNDLLDAPHDRLHPTKRRRPIARGELSPRRAVVLAVALGVVALGIAAVLGPLSLALLVAFVALQLVYSLRLKRLVLIDVMTIAGLFVIRAAAGAVAVDVRISPWLLLCTALLALFLALAKRRAELALVGADGAPGRPVLDAYSLPFVDQLLASVAGATTIAYSIYTFSAHSAAMMLTIPFVLFGLFRYLLLVQRRELGEEPEEVLLQDVPIMSAVVLWVVTAAIILAVS